MHQTTLFRLLLATSTAFLFACPEPTETPTPDMMATVDMPDEVDMTEDMNTYVPPTLTEVPATYDFPSRFVEDDTGVRYNGQALRHVLISDLNDYIASQLDADVANSTFADKDAVLQVFVTFLESTDLAEEMLRLSTDPATLQKTYGELSGGTLLQKLAGNDSATDYKDWKTGLEGWQGQASAEGLLRELFDQLATQSFALQEGTILKDPVSGADLPVYVTPEGLDLKQLIQKYLLMSVTFAQATDDYLASGTDGKGLESSNAQSIKDGNGQVYSGLEHVWDEGYGYFGAARDYSDYSDDEIANKGGDRTGYHDTNADGAIDLKGEYNYGASVNAAKRDRGSADAAKTDFTKDAFDALRAGRLIIYNAGDTLTAAEKTALEAERDKVVEAWEGAIAATALHYINDTLQVMKTYETDKDSYTHADHAKVWSELKGFAIGFQFNPESPMLKPSAADAERSRFVVFHELIGDAPALPDPAAADGGAAFQTYKANLRDARNILKTAYGFDDANLGDDDGENGW